MRIKNSRPIPIDAQAASDVISCISSDAITVLTDQQHHGIRPSADTRPLMLIVASGEAGCFHTESVYGPFREDGKEFHKVYRHDFVRNSDGVYVSYRRD